MRPEDMIVPGVRNMSPSGIRKYFDMVNEMEDVISLGIGEPDFVTPWGIREAGIYSLEKGHTHYSSNSGFAELRREIASYMKRRFSLTYDYSNQIIVTVGGSEAIDVALRALAGPGDEVVIPEPSFVAYKGCAAISGSKPVTVELRDSDEFRLTPDLLEKALSDRTKVVILPFPNNPTGAIMNKRDIEQISELLRNRDIIVLSDELYAELTYETEHVSIASLPGMKEKTVVINGFSKAYAMTGWRIGYACGNSGIIDAMKKIHQYALMCSPTTAQYAAIEALRNGDEEVRKMAREYNRRRRVMVDGFRKIGLDCFEPGGAFYVFPSIKATNLASDAFCERLLKEERVLVVPGTAFGSCGEGFIRATYANSMDNILEAMSRIRSFVERVSSHKEKLVAGEG